MPASRSTAPAWPGPRHLTGDVEVGQCPECTIKELGICAATGPFRHVGSSCPLSTGSRQAANGQRATKDGVKHARDNRPEYERLTWRHLRLVHDIDSHLRPRRRFHLRSRRTGLRFPRCWHSFLTIDMHPGSSLASRRLSRPAIAFNSIRRFMLPGDKFFSIQDVIRKRETSDNGSVNPSVTTYGYQTPS
ncbi:YqcI/YcgG family protein [Amycolatopsis keratiniphila]|uniref:YqcI/YcgG family protein n=1 Tax=Amycolatopsis keratiniphila TaxID=129921 RepID=UPI0033F1EFA0